MLIIPRSLLTWFIAVAMLLVAATARADLKPRSFDIAHASGADNQILITIDTTNLQVNVRLEDVHVLVGFYDGNKRRVSTVDLSIGLLRGGAVARILRHYPAPPPSVMWIRGEQLAVRGDKFVTGGKEDVAFPTIESSSGFVSIGQPRPDVTAYVALAAPTQLSPTDGTVFTDQSFKPTFEWSSVPDAASYGLEVDCFHCCEVGKWCSDVGGNTALINDIRATRIAYADVNPQPYRWRVWVVGLDGAIGPKSPWATFSYR